MSSSPITARLAQLHEQWRSFTQCNEARLLIWQAADEEQALIDAFIAKECEAESAATPDIFLQLSTPYGSDLGHVWRPESLAGFVRKVWRVAGR